MHPKNPPARTALSHLLRTDLACESPRPSDSGGATYSEYRKGPITVARLTVEDPRGAASYGKEIGTYITAHCGNILYHTEREHNTLVELLVSELSRLISAHTPSPVSPALRVLVAGLGNAHMTADALGPLTAARLPVTRHLHASEDPALIRERERFASISVVAPGVLAETGIEAAELIRNAARSVSPHLVIVIDALAARSCERLTGTVQIADSGIRPGSGVGNDRGAINEISIGCPVIAIGVPTVVDSSALVLDALHRAGIREEEIGKELTAVLENGISFFVSPKEIDAIVDAFAALITEVLTKALSVPPFSCSPPR